MKGWKNVGVSLPESVAAIVTAAGGADPKQGGLPHAMASMLGTLAWIAVQLHKELPEAEYRAFANACREYMQQAWTIVGAENPPAAFDEMYAHAVQAEAAKAKRQ